MSEAEPIYRFSFFRPSEAYLDAWVEHSTFGRVNYRLGSENGMGILAYLMKFAGQPDGDIVASEVRRKLPLVQYFESLHRLAEYRQPCSVPPFPVLQALSRLDENPGTWLTIQCKNDLLARDYVIVEDGQATLTAAGNAARLGKVESETNTISTIAYTGLRQVQMGFWLTIDGRAKAYLLKNNLVDAATQALEDLHSPMPPIVTEAGVAAMTAYEAEYGKPEIAPPVEKVAREPKPAQEPKEKKTILSEKQVEAFRIAVKQPYRWDTVATRTRNFMLANDWVTVDGDDLPKLTTEGRRVYDNAAA